MSADVTEFPACFANGAVWGVEISSRYMVPAELALMARVVARLPAWARQSVTRLECDSKCGACYSVVMAEGCDREEITEPLGRVLSQLLLELSDGHNGVDIGTTAWLNPDWPGDWLDDEPAEKTAVPTGLFRRPS